MLVAEISLSSRKILAPSGVDLATISPVRLMPVWGLSLKPRAQNIATAVAVRRTIAVVRVIMMRRAVNDIDINNASVILSC